VSESIAIALKRVAVIFAEELNYARAAKRLNMTFAELQKQIATLETQLCFRVFTGTEEIVELTEEGQFLVKAFRESVALHDRNASKKPDGKS